MFVISRYFAIQFNSFYFLPVGLHTVTSCTRVIIKLKSVAENESWNLVTASGGKKKYMNHDSWIMNYELWLLLVSFTQSQLIRTERKRMYRILKMKVREISSESVRMFVRSMYRTASLFSSHSDFIPEKRKKEIIISDHLINFISD